MEAITTNQQNIGMLSAILRFASRSQEVVQHFAERVEKSEKKETETQQNLTDTVFQFSERLEKKVNSVMDDLGITLF